MQKLEYPDGTKKVAAAIIFFIDGMKKRMLLQHFFSKLWYHKDFVAPPFSRDF